MTGVDFASSQRPTTKDQRPTTNDGVDDLMRIAYLDCFSGISGDMFLGALMDAGVPQNVFEQAVAALNIGARLEVSRVSRSGISATKVDVIADEQTDPSGATRAEARAPHQPVVGGWSLAKRATHSHSYEHSHLHEHSQAASQVSEEHHQYEHQHDRHHDERQHGRGLKQILEIIGNAAISENAKRTAIAIFEKLGRAESKIHNVPIEKIHFHEVGAMDALVDIVCAAVGAEALGVDEMVCSSLNLGGGTVECAHGTFPVPAPATVELLKGAPVYSTGLQSELVTPTGAAIVATFGTRFSSFPEMKIEKTGYGAGARDFPGHANVLRIIIGELASAANAGGGARAAQASSETITVLEANLDDMNPQVFGYVMDRLLEAGALDVFGTPVQMKKSRPGTLLTILAKPDDAAKLTEIVFAETTTLGVRRREDKRQALARQWDTVSTRFGDVRIKIGSLNGTVASYAPEYEDCRKIAAKQRVPLKSVIQEAIQEYLQSSKAK